MSDSVRVLVPVATRLLLAELAERRKQSDVDLLSDLVLQAAIAELQRGNLRPEVSRDPDSCRCWPCPPPVNRRRRGRLAEDAASGGLSSCP